MESHTEYQWHCPTCGAVNTDYPVDTAMPLCGECDNDFLWDDLTAVPVAQVAKVSP